VLARDGALKATNGFAGVGEPKRPRWRGWTDVVAGSRRAATSRGGIAHARIVHSAFSARAPKLPERLAHRPHLKNAKSIFVAAKGHFPH